MISASVCLLLVCLLCAACIPDSLPDRDDEDWPNERAAMVALLRDYYKIRDETVLAAMAKVRRHVFIPSAYRSAAAYGDHPSPIGKGQTISQPFIVAYMTEQLALKKGEKVLEVGTGSGYQAAVLAEMGVTVFSIEIVPDLADHARTVLAAEGYKVSVRTGDGYKGWPDHAPYDAIIVTCAPEDVPQALTDQLKDGGRMIVPVGDWTQTLVILRKEKGKLTRQTDLPVRFVPMVKGKEPLE